MALSAFQVWYSQEYRYYAVFQLVALLSVFFYLMWLKHDQWLDFIAYVAFSVIAAYVHTYAIFFYAGIGLHFLTQWGRLKPLRLKWIASQVLIIIGILPQLLSSFATFTTNTIASPGGEGLGGGTPTTEWIPVPPLYAPLRTLINFVLIQRSYLSWTVIGIGAAVLLLGVAIYALNRRSAWVGNVRETVRGIPALIRSWDSRLILLALWLVTPLLLSFVFSRLIAPMYLDRYLIAAAPAWYLILALVIYALRRVIPIALSVAVVLIVIGGALYTYYTQDLKEQWRETAAYVQEHIGPGDALALSYGRFPSEAYNVRDSFGFYYRGADAECYVDVRAESRVFEQQLSACADGREHIWLVVYDSNAGGERLRVNAEALDERVQMLDVHEFIGTSVYLFDVSDLST
jgi:hypothetical protein